MTFVARNIDEVLSELARIVVDAKAEHSRLGYFAALYRQVTLEVKRGIVEGRFDDGPRMDRFDTAFGNRYFAALAAWQAGREPPGCWKVAFELLTAGDTIVLQHLLLGVNAHINLDLAFAAEEGAAGGTMQALSRDYDLINTILVSVLNKVQVALGEVSPCLGLLDELGGRNDEWALDFSLRKARKFAWFHALLIDQTGPEGRVWIEAGMDTSASALARLIARPAGILKPALEVIRYKELQDVPRVIDVLDSALANV